MTYYSTITSKGQVTLPVALRRALKIEPGQQVNFSLSDNQEIIITAAPTLAEIQKKMAQHFKEIGLTQAKLQKLAKSYRNGDGLAEHLKEKYDFHD